MEHKLNVADAITASRILFAVFIVFCSAFSVQFCILYFLGAFTDVIDGWVARKSKLKSSFGAKLDSIADYAFVIAVLAKTLSALYVPVWLWIWIAVIGGIKLTNLISSLVMFHRIVPMHTITSKVTGIMLFLLPLGIGIGIWHVSEIAVVVVVCSTATFAAIQEGHFIRAGKEIQ